MQDGADCSSLKLSARTPLLSGMADATLIKTWSRHCVLCPLESSTSQLLPMQYEDVHHPSSWNLLNDDAVILLHALACQVRHHLFPSAAYWIAYRATLTAWLQCMLHDNAVVSQHSLHGVGSVTDCTAATGLWD